MSHPFAKFFENVTNSSFNATVDVYAPMFFCDFILFLVLCIGYSDFGPVVGKRVLWGGLLFNELTIFAWTTILGFRYLESMFYFNQ